MPSSTYSRRHQLIPWERFWYPLGSDIQVDERGFLVNPRAEYGKILNPTARSLIELDDSSCLILLGEPGTGKSTELRTYRTRVDSAQLEGSTVEQPSMGGGLVVCNLADYDNIPDLVQHVFTTFSSAERAGDRPVTLLLDSFDEALMEIAPLATRLVEEFRKIPESFRHSAVRVRLACRSFEFPSALRDGLAELWPSDQFKIVEIAPLRWRDVSDMAESRLGQPLAMQFMNAIVDREAVSFAVRPATLDFLLREYSSQGSFPPTQSELYFRGCRSLAEEMNPSRLASRRVGKLFADDRVRASSRIAAATLFGNRRAVWAGPDRGDVPSTDLPISSLVGVETWSFDSTATPTELTINQEVLREVLSTGLFTILGQAERITWAHQSYAEFLAAQWVFRNQLSHEQVNGLFMDSSDNDPYVVPQLHGVAAWLASLSPSFYRFLADRDPQVLLRADTGQIPTSDRAVLVDALIQASRANTLRWRGFLERIRYERLDHPDLGLQLRPVLADKDAPEHTRLLALEIAEDCKLLQLCDECVSLALDSAAPLYLRARAASFIADLGDEEARALLLPLATSTPTEDVDDDIKGAALRASWRLLTPNQLFSAITRPRRPNRSGSYEAFFREFKESLRAEHLAPGLSWLNTIGHVSGVGPSQLEERLIADAFQHLSDDNVRSILATLMRRRFSRYEPLLDDELEKVRHFLENNANARRMLAVELIENNPNIVANHTTSGHADAETPAPAEKNRPTLQEYSRSLANHLIDRADRQLATLTPADFPWVLERLVVTPEDSQLATIWQTTAQVLFDINNVSHVEYLFERREEKPIETAFGSWFRPLLIDGPEAKEYHTQQREMERWQRRRDSAGTSRKIVPDPSESTIREMLDAQGEGASWRAWPAVCSELERSRTKDSDDAWPELYATPLWKSLPVATRARVIASAVGFLNEATPPRGVNVGHVRFDRLGGPAYKAFRMVDREALSVDAGVWRRWFSVLCAVNLYTTDEREASSHQKLLRKGQASDPKNFGRAIGDLVDFAVHSESEGRSVGLPTDAIHSTLGRPRVCPDDFEWTGTAGEVGAAREYVIASLLSICANGDTPSSILFDLLGPLLAVEVAAARDLAKKLIHTIPRRGPMRQRAIAAAAALLKYAPDAGWEDVWPVMRRSQKFSEEVALWLAANREQALGDVTKRLKENQVADLYIWLARTYPPDKDPWHVGVFSPVFRDNVMHWRDGMLTALEQWGTQESIAALRRIAHEFPERAYLSQPVLRALASLQTARWSPPGLAQVLALAENRSTRIVHDASQLLEVIVESLVRYGEQLQGELPAVESLWNKVARKRFEPKDEGHLTDDLIRHLRRDLRDSGIVVGCELVVDRGVPGIRPGSRTDVIVTALALGNESRVSHINPVSVIIEVKGSWNPQVRTAMKSQLADTYLADTRPYRHGLYVVGWYSCAAWADGVKKARSSRLGTFESFQSELERQAVALSGAGRMVRSLVVDTRLGRISRSAIKEKTRRAAGKTNRL